MPSTFIIAEAGSCHDNSYEKAQALVDAAKAAGAHAVKFQFWSSPDRMARRRHAEEFRSAYATYCLPELWLSRLHAYCGNGSDGIEFMCSTYLPEDVEVVAPFVTNFKIASCEANDPAHLVSHVKHATAGKRIFISMGLGASFDVIDQFLVLPSTRLSGRTPAVRLLHCVSAYPAPINQLNLIRLRWDYPRPAVHAAQLHGYSDHAPAGNTWTGALAVAAGASIIERHLRLDETFADNPDFAHAMPPAAFADYVRHIRIAEDALGTSQLGSVPAEAPMRAYRVRE